MSPSHMLCIQFGLFTLIPSLYTTFADATPFPLSRVHRTQSVSGCRTVATDAFDAFGCDPRSQSLHTADPLWCVCVFRQGIVCMPSLFRHARHKIQSHKLKPALLSSPDRNLITWCTIETFRSVLAVACRASLTVSALSGPKPIQIHSGKTLDTGFEIRGTLRDITTKRQRVS